MTTMEGNRLIAEFIGYEVYPDGYCDTKSADETEPLPMLEYMFNSWNEIMPVVEKIESIEDEHRCAKYNVIIEQSWCEVVDNNNSDTISKGDADAKITAVYIAVVEFIKWYNENSRDE